MKPISKWKIYDVLEVMKKSRWNEKWKRKNAEERLALRKKNEFRLDVWNDEKHIF